MRVARFVNTAVLAALAHLACSADPGEEVPPLTLSTVSPATGSQAGGTEATLTGTGLAGAEVAFGGVRASELLYSPDGKSLRCRTPPGLKRGRVSVLASIGTKTAELEGAFRFQDPSPTLASIAPSSAQSGATTRATLTGDFFLQVADAKPKVLVGDKEATSVVVVSSTRITCTLPDDAPGMKDVTVVNPDDERAVLAAAFERKWPLPTVTSVEPASGTVQGGTAVTITGTGFAPSSVASVAGKALTGAAVVDATTITGATPAGDPGPADVGVLNPSGSGVLGNGFTYTSPRRGSRRRRRRVRACSRPRAG